MLVLSRKKNESIVIHDDITVVVVEIRGDKVRLGVEAPKEVPVHRREVYEAIQRGDTTPQDRLRESLTAYREKYPTASPRPFAILKGNRWLSLDGSLWAKEMSSAFAFADKEHAEKLIIDHSLSKARVLPLSA